jgi:hypothetical protein
VAGAGLELWVPSEVGGRPGVPIPGSRPNPVPEPEATGLSEAWLVPCS